MAKGKIELKVSSDDAGVAYLSLPRHPGTVENGLVDRQLALEDLVPSYRGPSVYLDFDCEGYLIGIEIVD